MNKRIIITVEGGLVYAVHVSKDLTKIPVSLSILDKDIFKHGTDKKETKDTKLLEAEISGPLNKVKCIY